MIHSHHHVNAVNGCKYVHRCLVGLSKVFLWCSNCKACDVRYARVSTAISMQEIPCSQISSQQYQIIAASMSFNLTGWLSFTGDGVGLCAVGYLVSVDFVHEPELGVPDAKSVVVAPACQLLPTR